MVHLIWFWFLPWGSWPISWWAACQHCNLLECPTVSSCLFAPVIIRPLPVTHRRCGSNNPQQVFNSTGEKYPPGMLYWCVRATGWESRRRETSLSALCFYYLCVQGSMYLLTHLLIFFLQLLLDSHLLRDLARRQSYPGSLCYINRACYTSSPSPFPSQAAFYVLPASL